MKKININILKNDNIVRELNASYFHMVYDGETKYGSPIKIKDIIFEVENDSEDISLKEYLTIFRDIRLINEVQDCQDIVFIIPESLNKYFTKEEINARYIFIRYPSCRTVSISSSVKRIKISDGIIEKCITRDFDVYDNLNEFTTIFK